MDEFKKTVRELQQKIELQEDQQDEIEELKKRIDLLENKRIYQMDITPQAIKNRHLGEPNSYVFSGLAVDRPTTGVSLDTAGLGCSIYWAYDTGVLSIWNGTAWLSETLT